MSKIQIKAEIDATNLSQVEAAANFLRAVGEHTSERAVKIPSTAPVKTEQAESKEMSVVKNEEVKETTQEDEPSYPTDPAEWTDSIMKNEIDTETLKDACADLGIDFDAVDGMNTNAKLRKLILAHFAEAPGTKTETKAADKKPASTGGANINQVREAITAKIKDHKEAIKKKLTDLDAKNVSALEESDYDEFLDFLKAL